MFILFLLDISKAAPILREGNEIATDPQTAKRDSHLQSSLVTLTKDLHER